MFRGPRAHVRLMLRVARRYYLDGADQHVIAAEIGYSRPTVSRLLAEAREAGIVRFSISHPVEQSIEYETQLRSRFGLAEAAVAWEGSGTEAVARLAARAIAERGGPRTVLALSHGTTVSAVVDAMPDRRWPLSSVVPMAGAAAHAGAHALSSPELSRRLALQVGGVHRELRWPLLLPDPAAARTALREEGVLTTFELAARADIAVSGVGAVAPDGATGTMLSHDADAYLRAELRQRGAVAYVCGRHFDARGREVRTSLSDRLIALHPGRLAEARTSMAVGCGQARVPALHAVLSAGFVSCLVTDEATARGILAHRP